MALNVGQLRAQIQNVFDQRLESIPQIATKIAKAYQAYATAAQAPPGSPVVLKGTEYLLFEQALVSLMRGRLPAPQAAQAIGNAVTSFWMVPPVMTGSGGVVTAVVPQAAIAKMASTKVSASSQAATSLAQSLDLITRTVFVTNPSPVPPGVLF
jgi:hypothetical protein